MSVHGFATVDEDMTVVSVHKYGDLIEQFMIGQMLTVKVIKVDIVKRYSVEVSRKAVPLHPGETRAFLKAEREEPS